MIKLTYKFTPQEVLFADAGKAVIVWNITEKSLKIIRVIDGEVLKEEQDPVTFSSFIERVKIIKETLSHK